MSILVYHTQQHTREITISCTSGVDCTKATVFNQPIKISPSTQSRRGDCTSSMLPAEVWRVDSSSTLAREATEATEPRPLMP